MNFEFRNKEKELAERIGRLGAKLGYPVYFVGGFVRDRLLGRNSKDIDFVCVGDGIELAQKLADDLEMSGKVIVYKRFGTAMLSLRDMELEFVGARKESYSKDSRKPAVAPGSLADDQNRRDFTINALAVALSKEDFGKIIDPFNGIEDLENCLIRTPLDPDKTFSDDPLRMMRAIRFACQLDFNIEEETFNGIIRNADRIDIISKERISSELNKIILSNKPSIGFELMSKSGLLKKVFPEFERLRGVEIVNKTAHKDNYYHTLQVLDNLSEMTDNLWLRWAAVLHDIAKPATKKYIENIGWTFYGHEVVGAKMVYHIFKRFRLPLDHKMKYVQKLVRLHLRPISLTREDITDSAIRRLLFDAGEDIDDLMLLCKADITSKNERKVIRIKENYDIVKKKLLIVEESDKIRNWQPPISGDLIMKTFNIEPSRLVGDLKDKIREAILEGDIPNEYEAAYKYMVDEAAKLGLTVINPV